MSYRFPLMKNVYFLTESFLCSCSCSSGCAGRARPRPVGSFGRWREGPRCSPLAGGGGGWVGEGAGASLWRINEPMGEALV